MPERGAGERGSGSRPAARGRAAGTPGPRPGPQRPRGATDARAVDGARLAAYALLRAVQQDDAYANLVWPRILRDHGLVGRDAAFATELAYGTLRWQGRHDRILAACVDRGLASVQPAVLDALRLGVHQLHAMRVPPHAAVAETVALVRARANPAAAGFANAVLRRVAAGGAAERWLGTLTASGALPALADDPAAHLAVVTSHPAWIVRAVHEALAASEPDRTWVDTRAALLADNAPAGVTLAARTLPRAALLADLAAAGVGAEPGLWARTAVRVRAVDPASLPAVATGAAGVQDEGSQLVALLLADAPLDGPDLRWADLCAGPGGKAALLAGAAAERGGSLTAVEQHPHRAELVRAALRPVRGRHEVLVGDATALDLAGGFDRILVDAPCTGLGALRRRPESRWRRSPEDLPALAPLQRALLARAVALLRPGGLACYATCSPHLAETEAVVATVERRGGRLVPVGELGLDLPEGSVAGPYLRLWPHRHDTDGMFAALVRREA